MAPADQVADSLRRIREGDKAAVNELMQLMYPELHRIAAIYFHRERRDHTLQPTALVNETYLRMMNQRLEKCEDRVQFLSVAAMLMRRILLNYARTRQAGKRGDGVQAITLEDAMAVSEFRAHELLAIDEALTELAAIDAEQARVVEMHFFGGMSFEEIAQVLGFSAITAKRRWASARAWLCAHLTAGNRLTGF